MPLQSKRSMSASMAAKCKFVFLLEHTRSSLECGDGDFFVSDDSVANELYKTYCDGFAVMCDENVTEARWHLWRPRALAI